jgi:hypothetical protein
MNRAMRLLLLAISALSLNLFLTGSKISDYPFKKTPWGVGETTRVKHLKNLSEAEIKKEMKKIANGIGVKCTHCHNEKNYASEEKAEKEFARVKIGLVKWLNAKYRPANADWEYSCWSCHRGKVKPVDWMPPGAAPKTAILKKN